MTSSCQHTLLLKDEQLPLHPTQQLCQHYRPWARGVQGGGGLHGGPLWPTAYNADKAAELGAEEAVRLSGATYVDMMTSSNGNIFRVTGPLCGEFTGPGEFPAQRPVTRSLDVSFDLRLNTWLSKQPWGWWFETLSWSLWRQCNDVKLKQSDNLVVSGVASLTVQQALGWYRAICCNENPTRFPFY